MRAMLAAGAVVGVLLVPAGPAAIARPLQAGASGAGRSTDPLRVWSVSSIRDGAGATRAGGGVQARGVLHQLVDVGPSAFNFGKTSIDPDPQYSSPVDGRASGEVRSSADGAHYSVAAQAPVLDHRRSGSPKGAVTHLDEYQAYEKRSGDASLRITITNALVEAVDDSLGEASECVRPIRCSPIRSVVRVRARAYAESAGGDFFDASGVAFALGHFGAWEQRVAASADARRPLWTDDEFTSITFCADSICLNPDAGALTHLNHPRTLKVPLKSVRVGELFGVHVSLEAETVDGRGVESAGLAFISDPQERGPALLTAHGLTPRGKPRFKEPAVRSPKRARCPAGRPRRAGTLQLSGRAFTADESDRSPLVLVTRRGGSRGAASITVRSRADSATAGIDFTPRTGQ